jgi:hypothetical protein
MTPNHLVRTIAGLTATLGLIASAPSVQAQRRWEPLAQIETGTAIQVRTTQAIRASAVDGRVYNAVVDNDVLDDQGRLAIQAGSTAELIVRPIGGDEMEIDLDSVTVGGRRYAVRADSTVVGTAGDIEDRVDKRTAERAICGAVVGSIIGAIAGGKKGAAIGAGVGAAAGAGTDILTRGRSVDVPADALLTYRLTRPLNIDVRDTGYDREGVHYHRWR